MLNLSLNNNRKILWIAMGCFLLVLLMYNEWIKKRIESSPSQDPGVVPLSSVPEAQPEPLTQNIPSSIPSKAPQPEAGVERSSGLAPAELNKKEIIYEFPSNEKILIQ